MKILDWLFKDRKGKAALTNVSATGQATYENRLVDVPKLYFADFELQVTVGQWLGILSSQQGFGNSGFTMYTHLSAQELMKRTNITDKQLEEIAYKFGLLFKMAGIEATETCILRQYNKDNFSFNCYFENAGDNASISMRWADMFDSWPEFDIDYKNTKKTYYYNEEYEDTPMGLNLQYFTKKNTENGIEFYHYISEYSYIGSSTDGENKLRVEIEYPESIASKDGVQHLPYIDIIKVEELLLTTTFPMNIEDIYKAIASLLFEECSVYPKINIKITKIVDKKETDTTDLIQVVKGQPTDFIATRDGRKIQLDNLGGWRFNSNNVAASQTAKGKVSYSIVDADKYNGAIVTSIEDQLKIIEADVEDARALKKSLF